jgi:DNA-directed RNA polymerase subunit RPC12/RpoP
MVPRREYDCPVCQFPILTDLDADRVKCPDCGSHLRVEADYSFDDGQWRDHTALAVEGR